MMINSQILFDILGFIVFLGISGLISYEGFEAVKTGSTKIKNYNIIGFWAKFVGVVMLILGLPLFFLGLWLFFMYIFS